MGKRSQLLLITVLAMSIFFSLSTWLAKLLGRIFGSLIESWNILIWFDSPPPLLGWEGHIEGSNGWNVSLVFVRPLRAAAWKMDLNGVGIESGDHSWGHSDSVLCDTGSQAGLWEWRKQARTLMRASLLGWEILSKLSSSLGLTFTVYE